MDKISLKEYNKGKWNFVLFLLISIVTLSVIAGIFTTYKQETLVCDKTENVCYVEKTNLIDMKNKKRIIQITDISSVTSIPQRVSGNKYAKGYTSYFLAFKTKKNNPIIIFSTEYYEKDEIDEVIKVLLTELKDNSQNIININRN